MADPSIEEILPLLTLYHNHPIPGQDFLDIFPLFRNPKAVNTIVKALSAHILNTHSISSISAIVCLEARGFFFGPLVAANLGLACIPARKNGKLPGETVSVSYQKEYGPDVFEMKTDAFEDVEDGKVILLDDLLATGGSAVAVKRLLGLLDREVAECVFIFDVPALYGMVDKVIGGTPYWAPIHLTDEIMGSFKKGK